jgi:hypothetical protein
VTHTRFAPVLRYLVETREGLYTHPSRAGLVSGREAWADHTIQFDVHADAMHWATQSPGRTVVKLRVRAEREPVRHSNRPNLSHVPKSGRDAFASGWDTKACPHDPRSVAAMIWHSEWWRANAEAFADHIGTPIAPALGAPIGLRDRLGQPIHIGDTLSFDETVWGGPCTFTIDLEDGEVQMNGGPSDMDQHCEIVREWDDFS